MQPGRRRGTTVRDRHRKTILSQQSHCGICHEEVDKSLPYLHPRSAVVDHITPIARGGLDELSNKQLSHRACNREKGDKLPGEDRAPAPPPPIQPAAYTTHATGLPVHMLPPGVTFTTARSW